MDNSPIPNPVHRGKSPSASNNEPPAPSPEPAVVDFSAMLGAQAAKYEARLAAQDQIIADLQNRMLAQEQQHGVNSEGVGSASTVEEVEEDFNDRPKIAAVWQTMFALTFFAAPILNLVAEFGTDQVEYSFRYFNTGQALFPLSGAGGLLLTVSDPSNTRLERPIFAAWTIAILAVSFAWFEHYDHDLMTFLGLLIGFAYVSCLILCRRKLANLPHSELHNYVYNRVFFYGIRGIPPMVYVTVETLKCYIEHWSNSNNFWRSCSATYFPQMVRVYV